MRRLNPVVTLTTALLTAASAASSHSSFAQDGGSPVVRSSPTAPEAPSAIASSDPMASARSPRHLLRNGQDYLRYGEYLRALTLFREAEARIGELSDAEQRELRQAIEDARQGMRSPEATEADGPVTARRGPSRSRTGAMPGAIALADPPRVDPGPLGSPDGVLLTGGERPGSPSGSPTPAPAPNSDMLPPIPPEPIAIDPRVLPSAAQASPSPVPPDAIELPPIASQAPAPASEPPATPFSSADIPELPPVESPAPAPESVADSLPTLPAASDALPELPPGMDSRPVDPPTAVLSALPDDRLRGSSNPPSPPAELPALPPSAEDLMELGNRAVTPPASVVEPVQATPTPTPTPTAETRPVLSARSEGSADVVPFQQRESGPYRDLLSPEQREEIMMIVRRQEEAERQGLTPAPLPGDPSMPLYDEDETAGTSIELPRPPSPSEIRPIQSIPVAEDFVPLPPRRFAPSRKYWSAAATCHLPLYFQDPVLERYGQSVEQKLGPVGRFLSYPLDDPSQSQQRNQIAQPFFSAGLMAVQIATWPYKALMDTPSEAEYDLGYYRPGDLVPPDLIYAPVHGVGPPLRGKRY